jgi:hypothetical protein
MRSSFEQKPMQHEFQCEGLPGLEGTGFIHLRKGTTEKETPKKF